MKSSLKQQKSALKSSSKLTSLSHDQYSLILGGPSPTNKENEKTTYANPKSAKTTKVLNKALASKNMVVDEEDHSSEGEVSEDEEDLVGLDECFSRRVADSPGRLKLGLKSVTVTPSKGKSISKSQSKPTTPIIDALKSQHQSSSSKQTPIMERRSPRILAMMKVGSINAKKTLGEAEYTRLKQKRQVENQMEKFLKTSDDSLSDDDSSSDEYDEGDGFDDEGDDVVVGDGDGDGDLMERNEEVDEEKEDHQVDDRRTPISKKRKNPFQTLENTPTSKRSKILKSTPNSSKQQVDEDSIVSNPATSTVRSSTYFSQLAAERTAKTSNNTFANAKLPTISMHILRQTLQNIEQKHVEEKLLLKSNFRGQYKQFYFQILHGFNLLFFGFGSKKAYMDKFVKEFLIKKKLGTCLVINGFFPSITIKQILNEIIEGCINLQTGKKKVPRILRDQVAYIKSIYDTEEPIINEEDEYVYDDSEIVVTKTQKFTKKLFLIINNIEGQSLCNDKTQMILSQLSTFKNIHIIATIDHQNASLMWDQKIFSQFNFSCNDLTTFDPYTAETSFETSLSARVTGDTAKSASGVGVNGVMHVLRSLPMNSRKVFRLFCEFQVAAMERSGEIDSDDEDDDDIGTVKGGRRRLVVGKMEECGMSFESLFQRCIEKFYASSRPTLTTNLVEFKDHQLLKESSVNGDLYIPLNLDILKRILELLKQE